MTDERERAGDVAAARTCRGILLRLMRQWTLDAGLPGTRLTAAELLARTIDQLIAVESSRPQSQPSTHAAERIFGIDSPTIMSTQLRKWREAYKTFAHAHPSPQLMNFADVPDFAPEEHARLQTTVFITSWFAAAAAFAAIVALALAWPLVRRGPTLARCLRMWILAGIAAAVTLIAAPLVAACAPAMISEQLRDLQMVRDAERIADVWSQRRYVPWYPFVAALLIAAPLLAALAVRPRITAPNALGSALARVGAVAAQTWLLLSVCLLIAALCGQGRREEYERAVADGYRRGVIETVVGPDTDCLLAPLRDWKP